MNMFMTASVAGTPIGMLASGSPLQPALPRYHDKGTSEHEITTGNQCPGDQGKSKALLVN